jgi:hypothetical protein
VRALRWPSRITFAENTLVAPPPRENGKVNEMPCHHKREEYLDAYIKEAGIAEDGKGPLFRPALGPQKNNLGRERCRVRMSGTWCAAALPMRGLKPR